MKTLAWITAAVMTSSVLFGLVQAPDSEAYSSRNLIDNAVFTKKTTMNTSQIQSFLRQRGSGLADKSWSGKSAAKIIYDASQDWGINPRVILATLQKEQSLITDPTPSSIQIRSAMGYGCPDNGSCSTEYSGFSYQVNNGTWQLRFNYERASGNTSWYNGSRYACYGPKSFYSNDLLPGKKVTFYRNTAVRGSINKTFTIANAATASLYCYTPHAGPYSETGYSGSYNFVVSFGNWFGSLHSNVQFKAMKTPRWMDVTTSTRKVNPYTGITLDDTISAGTRIYFEDSITSNGKTYLRTKHDSSASFDKGILLERLDEVTLQYDSMKYPRWLEAKKPVQKVNPRTGEKVGSVLPVGTQLFFPTSTTMSSVNYIRTQADTHNGEQTGIAYSTEAFKTVTPTYRDFALPRWVTVTSDTKQYDIKYPGGTEGPIITKGTRLYLDKKITINGRLYATDGTPTAGSHIGVPLDATRDLSSSDFKSLKQQRTYRLNQSIAKLDVATNQPDVTQTVQSGTQVYFQTLIMLDGELYLRSAHDTRNEHTTVVPMNSLTPVDVSFSAMAEPRRMKIKSNVKKQDPVTLRTLDEVIPKGRSAVFAEKVSINGQLYLRTAVDTEQGHYKVLPLASLSEL